jgi:hypothetical protein
MQMELMKWLPCCGISWHLVKASIFGNAKWNIRGMNMVWSHICGLLYMSKKVLIKSDAIMKVDIELSIRIVKPKWRGYNESWIGLSILMFIKICDQNNMIQVMKVWWTILRVWVGYGYWLLWDFNWMLNVGSRYDVTWRCLNKVKIGRKGFQVTKRRWRASDGLDTEVPW